MSITWYNDLLRQVLYYIHYRSPAQSFAEGEEVTSPSEATPTLSALQFHAALPHETVVSKGPMAY